MSNALTPREVEVLEHIVAGRSNKEIATALGLSVYTVKEHANHMMRKTGTRNRTHAAVVAVSHLGFTAPAYSLG